MNRIAKWDGATWSPLGVGLNNNVFALTTLPNGDVLAGGSFTTAGGVSANRVARWNGSTWSPVGTGADGNVGVLRQMANGDVAAGGSFTTVGGQISASFARLTTTCPTVVTPVGAGCTGAGGLNVLTATSLPWTGSSFTAVATGMLTIVPALALGLTGFSTVSVPLQVIFAQGLPGCMLLVSPDFIDVFLPVAGTVATQVTIPNNVSLAGISLHQQIISIELDAFGFSALTSTNAVTFTVGSF